MNSPECLWEVGAILGEGPVWVERERALYFVDIKGHRIHRYDPASGAKRHWDMPGPTGFVFPRQQGGFVAGIGGRLYTFDETTGEISTAAVVPIPPGDRINDGHVDAKGRLWFGTLNESGQYATGRLHRYLGEGRLLTCDSGYVVTNGPVTSLAGDVIYHADSNAGVVYAFDLDDGGFISGKREFVRFERDVYPDGMALDCAGNIWIAVFDGWRVDCYSPTGERLQTIAFPCARVTKPAFGGEDLRTLYVTSAKMGLDAKQLDTQPLAGALFAVQVDTPGAPAHLARDV